MKLNISADEHGALPPAVKSEYTKQDDGSFQLRLEDVDLRDSDSNESLLAEAQRLKEENRKLKDAKRSVKQLDEQVLKEYQDTIGSLKQQIHTYAVEGNALRAIAEHNGNEKMLLPFLRERIVLDDKNRPFVKNEDGQPLLRKSPKSTDDYLPISEYVSALRTDEKLGWQAAFKSNGAQGSNAQRTNNTKPAANFTTDEHGTLHFNN